MIIIAGGRATPRVIEGDLNYAFEPNQGYLSDIWQFNLSKNSMRWAKSRTCGPPEHFMRAMRLASPLFPLLSHLCVAAVAQLQTHLVHICTRTVAGRILGTTHSTAGLLTPVGLRATLCTFMADSPRNAHRMSAETTGR